MPIKLIKLFLRLAISIAFLSAVADRFGFWDYHVAWGTWGKFEAYTHTLIPWVSGFWNKVLAIAATVAETGLGLALLIGWKVKYTANLSGILLLLFALAMTFSVGIKAAFDASVFTASAAAFALGTFKVKFLELK